MRIDPPDTESTFDTAADDSGDITIRDERGYLRNLKLLTPAELIAPGVCPAEPDEPIAKTVQRKRQRWARSRPASITPEQLMRRSIIRYASASDLSPPVPRPGSQDALQWPNRIGNRLHYRDGRVTDMEGQPC